MLEWLRNLQRLIRRPLGSVPLTANTHQKEETHMWTAFTLSIRTVVLTLSLTTSIAPHVSVAQVVTPDRAGRLTLTFVTGGDDLRGGNDNLDVFLVLRDGKILRFDNVNRSQTWGNNSRHEVTLLLPPQLKFEDLVALRLETHATGGVAGDNWNLDRITMQVQLGGETRTLLERSGTPLFRFTGEQRAMQILLPGASGVGEVRAAPVNTPFRPETHGFQFGNYFKFPFLAFDIAWEGLCGGMCYSALDYYFHRMPVPSQRYMPSPAHALHSYLFRRQRTSVLDNADKWAELKLNPGGARDREFFNWGLQVGSGRLGELRRNIDAGQPVVIGLLGMGNTKSHQVVAIAYDLGRYYGDLSRYPEDVRIVVYDPNYPRTSKTLRADVRNGCYYYQENPDKRWRTYFVDLKYRPQRPSVPATAPPQNEVWCVFKTGGDDLRGGNDNVHLILLLRDGRQIRFENVNDRQRWMDNSWNEVARPLPDNLRSGDIIGIRLETTFGGGIGGDNWNLDHLTVYLRFGREANWQMVFDRSGTPLFRFTGEQRVRDFLW